ncbi:MAG: helix-turn-helix domain-containing protein [Verrucomicrobiaceae bacterium]|nr:MAG: helix-turn-helix domain-containing protein [Verrucomicrobiaceae bacterium]
MTVPPCRNIHFAHNPGVSMDPTAVPPFRHLLHRLCDPEEFGVAVSGARLSANFLGRQSKPTLVEQFQTPGLAFDFHEAHVKARLFAPLPPGWATVGLVRSKADSSWYGTAAGQGALLCNPPGEPIDGNITPGFSSISVSVPVEIWERCRALAGSDADTFGGFAIVGLPPRFYQLAERRLRMIRHLLHTATMKPFTVGSAIREATDYTISLMTGAWELRTTPGPLSDSRSNRIRLARRAEEWMHAHLSDPLSIPEICLALRVSRRELEYAFRTTFDESPRDFLQALRLNAIRRALLRSEHTVTRVALDHGVTHLGRFAENYRALFGESPGMTPRGEICR